MKKLTILVAILLLAIPATVHANWELAQGPSQIKFKVKHLVFSTVEGRFKEFEGVVQTAKENTLEGAQMSARITADSIYTGNKDRDKHLSSKDFFFTEQYPEISFISKRVEKASKVNEYRIVGDLTIRGITREVVLMGKVTSRRTLSNGTSRMDLVATSKLNRFDFGLRWNEFVESTKAIVGEDVQLELKLALTKNESEEIFMASSH